MSTILNSNDIAKDLYCSILKDLPPKEKLPKIIVVQHLVRNSIPLFEALAEHFEVIGLVPKPKSKDARTLDILANRSPQDRLEIVECTREEFDGSENPLDQFNDTIDDRGLIILDIGGYFAKSIEKSPLEKSVKAIIEDTENGHQKYELACAKKSPDFPIASVARSPLKEPEDFLVGQSIVYSCENILRENFSLLINKQALVIGYGKIGRSIANSLAVRNINVWVYDQDPIKRAQAMAHGFSVPKRDFAIANAGLIFCATGNKSLSTSDFKDLQNYAFVASVTSADDEFDMRNFGKSFKKSSGDGVTLCQTIAKKKKKKVFYLIRGGEAANFAHSNTLGVYIYLVACEILACLRKFVENDEDSFVEAGSLQELSPETRAQIAGEWIDAFFDSGLR